MNEELKQFDISIDEIKLSEELFDNLREAIDKMRLATFKDNFEVVLNNNLIECKEIKTQFKTILGCRISYKDLDKNLSFIVREDIEPSYEELQQQLKDIEEYLESIKDMPDADMYIKLGEYKEFKHILDLIHKGSE